MKLLASSSRRSPAVPSAPARRRRRCCLRTGCVCMPLRLRRRRRPYCIPYGTQNFEEGAVRLFSSWHNIVVVRLDSDD
jgi:hypothetical protein